MKTAISAHRHVPPPARPIRPPYYARKPAAALLFAVCVSHCYLHCSGYPIAICLQYVYPKAVLVVIRLCGIESKAGSSMSDTQMYRLH